MPKNGQKSDIWRKQCQNTLSALLLAYTLDPEAPVVGAVIQYHEPSENKHGSLSTRVIGQKVRFDTLFFF